MPEAAGAKESDNSIRFTLGRCRPKKEAAAAAGEKAKQIVVSSCRLGAAKLVSLDSPGFWRTATASLFASPKDESCAMGPSKQAAEAALRAKPAREASFVRTKSQFERRPKHKGASCGSFLSGRRRLEHQLGREAARLSLAIDRRRELFHELFIFEGSRFSASRAKSDVPICAVPAARAQLTAAGPSSSSGRRADIVVDRPERN